MIDVISAHMAIYKGSRMRKLRGTLLTTTATKLIYIRMSAIVPLD